MEQKIIEKTQEHIQKILDEGINVNNLDHLYKLSKIKHIAKEDENMNYGNYGNYYGRRAGYDAYGRDEYGNYGARGYDRRYRGHDYLDRMYNDYGRYMESRERYGANEDTKRSLKNMLDCMEDFARAIKEQASSPKEIEMVRQTAQRIASM